eukprot:Nk52_evm43s224 gene=Nk52_evmTU43s224
MGDLKSLVSSWKAKTTFAYFVCFGLLGMIFASLGPALFIIALYVSESRIDEGVRFVFTFRSTGYLVGSIIGGVLFDRFSTSGNRIVALGMLGCGFGTFVIPLCWQLWMMLIALFAQGIAMGFLDTGGNVMMMWLHKANVGPYLQAIHFAFAAGGLVAPLLLDLFTGDVAHIDITDWEGNASLMKSAANVFYLFGLLCVPPGIGLLFLKSPRPPTASAKDNSGNSVDGSYREYRRLRSPSGITGAEEEIVEDDEEDIQESDSEALGYRGDVNLNSQRAEELMMTSMGGTELGDLEMAPMELNDSTDGSAKATFPSLLFATGLLLCVYVGAEVGFAGYVYTFASEYLDLTNSQADKLTSVFWATLCLGRFVAIPLSLKLSPDFLLGMDVGGSFASMLLMFLGVTVIPVVWLSTALYGFFMSSVYPSALSFAEKHSHMTGRWSSFVVSLGCIGELIFPLIIPHFFSGDKSNYLYFVFILIGDAILMVCLFCLMFVLVSLRKQRTKYNNNDESKVEINSVW